MCGHVSQSAFRTPQDGRHRSTDMVTATYQKAETRYDFTPAASGAAPNRSLTAPLDHNQIMTWSPIALTVSQMFGLTAPTMRL
jgi:hypothetical protein